MRSLRKLLAGVMLALAVPALAGCSLGSIAGGISSGPAAIADTTVLDEQAGVGVELAYKGFRLVAEAAVDSGQVTGSNAAKLQAFDLKAKAAVDTVRLAFEAGNSNSYTDAVAKAYAAIAGGHSIIDGEPPVTAVGGNPEQEQIP